MDNTQIHIAVRLLLNKQLFALVRESSRELCITSATFSSVVSYPESAHSNRCWLYGCCPHGAVDNSYI